MLNAAVLGKPVRHSLSPVLHGAAYRALGLHEWRYAAHEVDVDELAGFVAGLDATWRGLSLTMPLKEAAFDIVSEASGTARATGAINTLVRGAGGHWEGHNTDVQGVEAALAGVQHDGSATLLGAGATARSALVALASLGVTHVRLAVRSEARPQTLRLATHCGLTTEVVPLRSWHETGGLVVSTLPPPASRAAAAALRARRRGTLMDAVYADWPTPLARAAAAAGMEVLSGLDMLVHQGAAQFRLFTGQEPPVEAMYAAGRRALGR